MPVTPTYVALATLTLASTDSEIVFSSIPATYRDLIVVVDGTTTATATIGLRFNGDTGTNYSFVQADGNGSSATSATSALNYAAFGRASTTQNNTIIQVMDYAQTDKHTTGLSRTNNTALGTRMYATRWANTSAVTSVTVMGATFNSGTVISMYGVN